MTAMTITVQQLRDLVADYWPRYGVNVDPMWKSHLRHHEHEKVKVALAGHRAQYPDEQRPIWQQVYARLVGPQTLPAPDHERRKLAVMQQRATVAQRIVTTEVPDDERLEAWEQFVSEAPPFVQERYRKIGWERFSATMAERLRPGRLAELMKAMPAPEVPPMPTVNFLKAGWDKQRERRDV